MGESSLTLRPELWSWIKLLRCDPGADPEFVPNTDGPVSGGAPLLQSNERQKADDPKAGLGPDPEGTSRELRWLRLLGHVEIRGRVLSAGVGVAEDSDAVDVDEAAAKSLLRAPQLPLFEPSVSP